MSKEHRNQLKGNSTGQIESNLGIKIIMIVKNYNRKPFTTDKHKLKFYEEWDIGIASKYFPIKY